MLLEGVLWANALLWIEQYDYISRFLTLLA
jgi:hypothetical protein